MNELEKNFIIAAVKLIEEYAGMKFSKLEYDTKNNSITLYQHKDGQPFSINEFEIWTHTHSMFFILEIYFPDTMEDLLDILVLDIPE